MFSGKFPVYCTNDTVGYDTSVLYGHWLAFLECMEKIYVPTLRFVPLIIHTTQIGWQ